MMLKDSIKPWFVFDLQRFADGDDGSGDGNGGQQSQVQQNFVEKKDPVTGKTVKIPQDMESVIGHFISSTRSEIESKYKPILEQLESEKSNLNDVKAELEKLKEANMTAEEKAQANAKRVIDEAKQKETTALKSAEEWKNRYEQSTIRNDIFSAFSEYGSHKLCNLDQLAVLFNYEGKAKISEKIDDDGKGTGEFETRVTLELVDSKGEPTTLEGTPKELFSRWIGLDRNAHHRKNELQPGGGSRTRTSPGSIDGNTSDMNPAERMSAGHRRNTN